MRLALIGFGEVGTIFATDFIVRGASVATYDILFDDRERREAYLGKARSVGAIAGKDARSACADAEIVISAVTASAAEEVATAAEAISRPARCSSTSIRRRRRPSSARRARSPWAARNMSKAR